MLYVEHNILITAFSFKTGKGDEKGFRFYFTDLNNNYLHNPMVKNEETGKVSFPVYSDYIAGLNEIICDASKYISKL